MPFGSPHRHFAECVSTNDLARAWALDADDPAPHGALVSADFQTRGRGRRGRQWQAGRGESVLMSVVVRPSFALAEAWQLAFVAALAVWDALSVHAAGCALKWPNDVLIGGNKVAGILVETAQSPTHGWAAVVGVGVNVGQSSFDPDAFYAVPPTSLRMILGEAPPTAWLTQEIAQALGARLARHAEGSWAVIRADWQAHMALNITLQRGTKRGVFADLEADGRARVRLPEGTFVCWATVDPEENTDSSSNQV